MASPLDDPENKVMIFSTSDERIKPLGKVLNSKPSMEILDLLNGAEMTANEIAEKTGTSLPLVIHHLTKMSQAGIVNISKIRMNSKNQPMKCYTAAKTGILILPEPASKKAQQSKSLSNSLRRIMRFSAVGVAGLASWVLTKPDDDAPIPTSSEFDGSVVDYGQAPETPALAEEPSVHELLAGLIGADPLLASMAVPAMVVAVGIGLNVALGRMLRNR